MRWRIGAAVGVVLLIALVAGGVLANRAATRRAGERRLRDAEAALDQSDPGWRLAELLAARDAARPPDARNLTKLCQDIQARRSAAFNQWSIDHPGWLPADRNRVPKPAEEAAAREAFATAEEMVALARTVRTRPTGGGPLVVPDNPLSISLEHTQRARTAAHLLHTDAVLAALAGDGRAAVAAVADGLHLCHAIGDEPFAVSQLVRAVMAQVAVESLERALGLGELPAADLLALEPLLRAEADFPRQLVGERGDRAVAHEVCARVDDGRLSLATLVGEKDVPRGSWTEREYRRFLPSDQAELLERYTKVVAIARRPHHEREPLFDALPRSPRDGRHILSVELAPTSYLFYGSDARCAARLRCAAAAAACERYRLQHGRWPDALPEPVPPDPYTGTPLKLAKRADGLTVYAAGPDRTDDGGNLSDESRPEKGQDVGFRLWDTTARRQPPPPPTADEWAVAVAAAATGVEVSNGVPAGTVVATLLVEIARVVSEGQP